MSELRVFAARVRRSGEEEIFIQREPFHDFDDIVATMSGDADDPETAKLAKRFAASEDLLAACEAAERVLEQANVRYHADLTWGEEYVRKVLAMLHGAARAAKEGR